MQEDESSGWSYNSGVRPSLVSDATQSQVSKTDTVEWTASEFIAHEKSSLWYMVLITVTSLFAIALYIFTEDIFTIAVVVIMAIAFGIYASRSPRTLRYMLDKRGVYITSRLYPYTLFKSFAVIEEGAINSIELMPLKRFMPSIVMYVAPDEEESIIDVLSTHLPLEDHGHGWVDNIMRRLRF